MTIENGASWNDPAWADDEDGSSVPPGWHPDGIMTGMPALNTAAAQSTLGAVMTPEQIADVDWGDDAPPSRPMKTGYPLAFHK